jgi:hypothetical protein
MEDDEREKMRREREEATGKDENLEKGKKMEKKI